MFISNEEPGILKLAIHDIIEQMIELLESKDKYTSGHSARVGDMSYHLAKKIGLTGAELEKVHIAAHLHDIGKIRIPSSVIKKSGTLIQEEWELMKTHPEHGFKILSQSPFLKSYAIIVLHHHERWDGKGYPAGLKGKEIPLGSRIIAICDTVDAMTYNRPYRKAFSLEETLREIKLNKGKQFDPEIVEAAATLWPLFEKQYGLANPGLKDAAFSQGSFAKDITRPKDASGDCSSGRLPINKTGGGFQSPTPLQWCGRNCSPVSSDA